MAEALQDLEKWNFPILFITFDYFLMKFATFLYQHAVFCMWNVLVSFSSRRHSSPPHLRHSTLLYSILFGTYDSTCVIGEIWTWYYNYEGIVYMFFYCDVCNTNTATTAVLWILRKLSVVSTMTWRRKKNNYNSSSMQFLWLGYHKISVTSISNRKSSHYCTKSRFSSIVLHEEGKSAPA